ncbi:MAG: peptide-methionine (R)-S-oxide reductase MsrB [Rhodospirillaceae bacterium]|nr:peptide-methionine (R)-S-oxide reductase MsrB [Rhodospirillaceae bacterium]
MSKLVKSEDQWRQDLSPEEFRILRQKGTERAFTGKYEGYKGAGTFVCAGCGQALFDAATKYNSGSGWPSFYQPLQDSAVEEHADTTHGMRRVEVTCSNCGGHLGHVFPDGPRPTGLRYCINSASLNLDEKK